MQKWYNQAFAKSIDSNKHVVCCLMPFSTFFQSYNGSKLTYSDASWCSHTSTPHKNTFQATGCFSTYTVSPFVKDK